MRVAEEVSPIPTARRRAAEQTGGTARLGRVLVVEDEPDVAELIRYHLVKEGYEVSTVSNGADAIKQAREIRPDLILLDLMIPQLNGWEVCRRLKQDSATRAVSVIVVTARGMRATRCSRSRWARTTT